jgi:hypothetical protein
MVVSQGTGTQQQKLFPDHLPFIILHGALVVQVHSGPNFGENLSPPLIRVIHKVRKIQHQYPEFGHKQREIQNKPAKEYISIQRGGDTQENYRKPSILIDGFLSFNLSFFYPGRLHCYYRYFHCSYLYSYYDSSRTLCIKC